MPEHKSLAHDAQALKLMRPFTMLIGLLVGAGVITVAVRIPSFSKKSDWLGTHVRTLHALTIGDDVLGLFKLVLCIR